METQLHNVVVIGASGHAQVIADAILKGSGYSFKGFIDEEQAPGTIVLGHPVLGKDEDLLRVLQQHGITHAIVGIGDNFIREKVTHKIQILAPNLAWATVIHPSAIIGYDVSIGVGTAIMAGAIVNCNTQVGAHTIINTGASLDHDNTLSDFVTIAPGVVTGGNVSVGDGSVVSIGATVKHQIHIGTNTVIGAGALVLKDIPDNAVAYGIPASVIRKRTKGEAYL